MSMSFGFFKVTLKMVTSLFKKAVVIFLFCSQSGQSFYESCARLCVWIVKRLYFGNTYSKLCVYGKLKGRYQVNLQEKKNHNQNFSEFSEREAIKLKKVASYFQATIHFHPGHLQPNTLIFTIRALVE